MLVGATDLSSSAAVWSLEQTAGAGLDDMDVRSLLLFLSNHGFLSWGTFAWRTPTARAAAVAAALRAELHRAGATVRTGAEVVSLRAADGVPLDATGAPLCDVPPAVVIMATHAPDARRVLGASAPATLDAFRTTTTRVFLHRDESLMPRDRSIWSSWNVSDAGRVTYWLAPLQHLADRQLFVSLWPGVDGDDGAGEPAGTVWRHALAHPQLQHGVVQHQRAVAALNERGGVSVSGTRVLFAGAWLGTGFHEAGVGSGALAARAALATIGAVDAAQRVPHYRVPVAPALTTELTWTVGGTTHHRSHLAGSVAFAYAVSHVVVDLEQPLPAFWWGGLDRRDHIGPTSVPLLHAVADAVAEQLDGRRFTGPTDIITTLRAFGQINNPISVFVLWADNERARIGAIALEVTSYPFGERCLYAFSAGAGEGDDTLRASGRFAKKMHVSPFHQFPSSAVHHFYDADVRIRRSVAARGDDSEAPQTPFASFRLSLRLFDGDKLGAGGSSPLVDPIPPAAVIHSASLVLSEPVWCRPSILPLGLRTSFLILRQAARIGSTKGRILYDHMTLSSSPISDVFVMMLPVCLAVGLVIGAQLLAGIVALVCVRAVWSGASLAPPVRDASLAATAVAAMLLIVS